MDIHLNELKTFLKMRILIIIFQTSHEIYFTSIYSCIQSPHPATLFFPYSVRNRTQLPRETDKTERLYIEVFQHPSSCHKVNSTESFSPTEKFCLASTGLFLELLTTVVEPW